MWWMVGGGWWIVSGGWWMVNGEWCDLPSRWGRLVAGMVMLVADARTRPQQFFAEGLIVGVVVAEDDKFGMSVCHADIYALPGPDRGREYAIIPQFGIEFVVTQWPNTDRRTRWNDDRATG